MKKIILSWTTAGGGGATTLSGKAIYGALYAVEYRPGSTVTGATVTITCVGDATKALLTKANAGTSNLFIYPRDLLQGADGVDLTGLAGGDRGLPLVAGYPKVVIASGGGTKTGALTLYYEE